MDPLSYAEFSHGRKGGQQEAHELKKLPKIADFGWFLAVFSPRMSVQYIPIKLKFGMALNYSAINTNVTSSSFSPVVYLSILNTPS